MVLIRRFALPLVVLAGCSESLFDAHGPGSGGGNGSDGGMVASACPSPCLADVAANFDGTPGGMGNHWRYLDDHRDRTWAPMTTAAASMTGTDPGNHITTCAAKPGAAACQMLPGALLVSSAGATSGADPAVEFTAKTNEVLKISVRAAVPSGDGQQIRIYRNSREDVLYTGTAFAGAVLEPAVTLDAIAGDRFLVAVAPTAAGATDLGLHVYVSATGAGFPSTCQIAVPFTAATGNTVDNVCGADFTYFKYNDTGADTPMPPVLATTGGPFAELGSVADIADGTYFKGASVLDKNQDITLQFWVQLRTPPVGAAGAWVFSDRDFDATNAAIGLGVLFTTDSPPQLDVLSSASATQYAEAIGPYPDDHEWHLVRIVYTGGNLRVCLDGSFAVSTPVQASYLKSLRPPSLGRNEFAQPAGAHFDGHIDDVRMLTGALPCSN